MTRAQEALLSLVRAVLNGELPSDPQLDSSQWIALLKLAESHKLLPLVLDAAVDLRSLRACPPGEDGCDLRTWKETALAQASRQVRQENEFLNLILALRNRGLEPLVVKGAVCRKLYPKPLLRPSVDDDLLIPPEQAAAFHAALQELDLKPDNSRYDPETDWELSYHRPGSPLYVELHKCLFDPKSPAFSGFNSYFTETFIQPCRETVQDVELLTPEPNLHLLFLILHAYKHFLHSGFGLRIVSDICLFSRAHNEDLDFTALYRICGDLRCHRFTAALYHIGEDYLGIPAPMPFAAEAVDTAPLLADILDAGLHGTYIDRLHSANITLHTVSNARIGGKAGKGGLRASLFPGASSLAGRYPFLERHPALLPVAWVRRIAGYLSERKANSGESRPTASLQIGRERVALLRQYDIID